jgi:hypothetical protein
MTPTTNPVERCIGILYAARSAARSTEAVADVIDHYDSNDLLAEITAEHVDFVLDEVQNILVQGGAVARALWPADAALQARAAALRAQYGLADDCALRTQPLAEVADRMAAVQAAVDAGSPTAYADAYVGASGAAPESALPRCRAYFYDTGVLEFLGMRYEIEPITRVLWRIAHGAP